MARNILFEALERNRNRSDRAFFRTLSRVEFELNEMNDSDREALYDFLEIIENPNWEYRPYDKTYIIASRGNGKSTATAEFLEKKPMVCNPFEIEDVIFNGPATIVKWKDGTKTVVKCQEDDIFDPEKGLAMAISKKAMGNKRDYYEVFNKHVGRYNKKLAKERAALKAFIQSAIDGTLTGVVEVGDT